MGVIYKIIGNTKSYWPKCQSFITAQSKNIRGDLGSSIKHYKTNAQNGWQIGKRLSQVKHMSKYKSFYTKIYSSIAKTRFRKEDIPALMGGIGAISPLPGGTVLGYVIGKILHRCLKIFK